MAQQNLTIGSADGGTGDTYFDAFTKVEANFTDLYNITSDINPTNQVVVNDSSDLPAPSGGVITLAADTDYQIGSAVNIGTDRIVIPPNSSITGSGRLSASLTYTGTSDMFSVTNGKARITNVTLSCTTGRMLNFQDNGDNLFVMDDVTVTCDRIALMNSTGGSGSVVRVSNVTMTAATDGATFQGGFNRVTWLVAGMNQTAGTTFALGTATFQSFVTDLVGAALSAGATYLSGAAASANILSGGVGVIRTTRNDGTGTMLSGITADDDRWDFYHNDRIRDTRSDGLLSMQGNATNTVITTQSVYVKVAGTWVVQPGSKFTGTTGGRLTYIGLKDVRHPVDVSLSIQPVAGTNKDLSARLAKNGTTIADSTRSVRVDTGSPLNVTVPWQLTLSTNDYIEVFVANDTGTTDLLITSATLRIN